MSDLRMPDLNKVIIAGRLTADPDLKYTTTGRAVCRLRLANTRYYRRKDGERGEETCYIDASLWDRQAEWVGESLRKGRPVIIEGRLRTDQWEDKSTGQRRSKVELSAQRVIPLDWDENRSGGGGYSSGASAPQNAAPQPRPIEEPIPEDDIPF